MINRLLFTWSSRASSNNSRLVSMRERNRSDAATGLRSVITLQVYQRSFPDAANIG
jgi:hypothetical protein